MNHTVTSKEKLLAAAKEIVFQEGADRLSIRCLSQKCGISIGSVYNYFPSKADLLFAVVEDFWKNVFHPEMCQMPETLSFPDFLEVTYYRLSDTLEQFRMVFLSQLDLMCRHDKLNGKQIEEKYLQHMYYGSLAILKQDAKIPKEIWTDSFTPEKFMEFIFANIMVMLKAEEKDCSFFKEVVCRLLQYER